MHLALGTVGIEKYVEQAEVCADAGCKTKRMFEKLRHIKIPEGS